MLKNCCIEKRIANDVIKRSDAEWVSVNGAPVCIMHAVSWKTRSLLLSDLVSRRPCKRDGCDLMEKEKERQTFPSHPLTYPSPPPPALRRKLSASLCCMIARIPFTWWDRLVVSEASEGRRRTRCGCRKAREQLPLSRAKARYACACPAVPH